MVKYNEEQFTVTESNVNSAMQKKAGFDEAVMGHIVEALTSFYQDSEYAVAREMMVNALDACIAAGVDKRVDVTLSGDLTHSKEVVFTDHGTGMTLDTFYNNFTEYGLSTKHEEEGQTGYYGFGSKTPYAVSETYTVITERNGERTLGVFIRDEEGRGDTQFIPQEPTGVNGTVVSIPLRDDQMRDMETAIKRAAFALPQYSVTLNGQRVNSVEDMSDYTRFSSTGILCEIPSYATSQSNVIIRAGGIFYPLDNMQEKLPISQKTMLSHQHIIIEADPKRYVPTPQRDQLRDTTANREILTQDIMEAYYQLYNYFQSELNGMSYLDAAKNVYHFSSLKRSVIPRSHHVPTDNQEDVADLHESFTYNDQVLRDSFRISRDKYGVVGHGRRTSEHYECGFLDVSVHSLKRYVAVIDGEESLLRSNRKFASGLRTLVRESEYSSLHVIPVDSDEIIEEDWLVIGGNDSMIPVYTIEEVQEKAVLGGTGSQRSAIQYFVAIRDTEEGVNSRNPMYTIDTVGTWMTLSDIRTIVDTDMGDDDRIIALHRDEHLPYDELKQAIDDSYAVVVLDGNKKLDVFQRRVPQSVLFREILEGMRFDNFISQAENIGGIENFRAGYESLISRGFISSLWEALSSHELTDQIEGSLFAQKYSAIEYGTAYRTEASSMRDIVRRLSLRSQQDDRVTPYIEVMREQDSERDTDWMRTQYPALEYLANNFGFRREMTEQPQLLVNLVGTLNSVREESQDNVDVLGYW